RGIRPCASSPRTCTLHSSTRRRSSDPVGRPRSVVRTQVPAILELVGLGNKGERFPHELSGGEQQRVSIARAFVNRPLILLATRQDRKSTRLNSSHVKISYAFFCLKKKE